MNKTTLPPQAYTRDILAKAYLWAQSQPESIKKLANTPDALVGLFLRAQRNGDTFENIAPVSRDNFMNDLKNLASELEQFDEPNQAVQLQQQKPYIEKQAAPATTVQPVSTVTSTSTVTTFAAPDLQIDDKSKALIQDVKNSLNLSSDTEVLRLLIVLGHNKAKSIFPSST